MAITEPKVERGIPIPQEKLIRSSRNTPRYTYPVRKMKLMDSFFIRCDWNGELRIRNSIAVSLSVQRKRGHIDQNFRLTVRRVPGGIRAWRIA